MSLDFNHIYSDFWGNLNTLKILFYFDEIEVKDPLGDASGVYKLGQFYFTILNLTRKCNSNLKNIFLVASAFCDDIKKYGMDRILEPIVREFKVLETEGILINSQNYFASIAQVTADNLGLHQLFGIKCCFIGQNLCHLCNANTQMIQSCFQETEFLLTTQTSYENKLAAVLANPANIPIYGINNKCLLNDLKYFHITRNYTFDITHDIWEGIAKYEIGLILEQFIKFDSFFTLDFLNKRISNIGYGIVEKKNKPSSLRMTGNEIKVKQKAAKTYSLFRFLLFLIGDRIPESNPHWELYLLLSRIVDIVISSKITLPQTVQLKWLVQEHHILYKNLFPDVTLKPKHHNMVHYPEAIRKVGNLIDYSTLRFEANHVSFKTTTRTIHNCNNILLSIVKKNTILNYFPPYMGGNNYIMGWVNYLPTSGGTQSHQKIKKNHLWQIEKTLLYIYY